MKFNDYIDYIKEKHGNQKRKQGTPYYEHPIAVSNILKEKGFSEEYQIIALFHDLLEDTDATYDDIVNISNDRIACVVKILTKEEGYVMKDYVENINNNEIAKMVKLADRIHNLSECELVSKEFIEKYIIETEMWYIPMAKNTVFEDDLNKKINVLKDNLHKKYLHLG